MTAYRIGIDMGGTAIKLALLDERLRILWETTVDNRPRGTPRVLVERIAGALRGRLTGVRSVGLGVAGDIDAERGIVRFSPNLGLHDAPLGPLLKKALKKPVSVHNDAKAAAWGIFKTQVPARVRHVVVLTLGTGVGGGIILNGKLHLGATGSAGEVGHMVIVPGGRPCHCGSRGCLEAYVGGVYLVREARSILASGRGKIIRRLAGGNPLNITPRLLNQAARRGDPAARRLWREAGAKLGLGISNLVNVLNPERVVLTGGLAAAHPLFLPAALKTARKAAFKAPFRAVTITIAQRARNIGVVGAALLAD